MARDCQIASEIPFQPSALTAGGSAGPPSPPFPGDTRIAGRPPPGKKRMKPSPPQVESAGAEFDVPTCSVGIAQARTRKGSDQFSEFLKGCGGDIYDLEPRDRIRFGLPSGKCPSAPTDELEGGGLCKFVGSNPEGSQFAYGG